MNAHTPYFLNHYNDLKSDLAKKFNLWKAPKLNKIILHCRFGKYMQDNNAKQAAFDIVKLISCQMPVKRNARKSMAPKVRKGMYSSVMSTLRGNNMYEFWVRLWLALPRIKNFEGFSSSSCDGKGGFSITIKDWTSFLECDTADISLLKYISLIELGICIDTSAENKEQTLALLEGMEIPFKN